LEKGSSLDIEQYFEEFKTKKIIIKPCISAGADNTFKIDFEKKNNFIPQINDLLKNESIIIQPFIEEIYQGEYSFIFFNSKFSHSLLKIPKKDDFRVQHFFGGTIKPIEPELIYIKQANKYVEMFAKGTLYARVDGIIKKDEFHLMELELIEPYLYLDTSIQAYENYYKALMELI
jgi:glutathione synthase/RimK-type ligase-like ATP-grasp enzyme